MNVTSLLERLLLRGIRITANGDRLAVSAPRGVLSDELKKTIRANRDDILQFLRESQEEAARREVRIERVDRGAPIPASYAQQRLWLIEQTATDLPVYNMYFALELRGDLDIAALRGAAQDLVDRHEILRTALAETGSELVQRIQDRCPVVFAEHEAGPDTRDDVMFSIVSTRFELSSAPLIRFDLVRTDDSCWTFVVTQHHVISDGWSTGILKKEISELYTARVEGRRPQLPELSVQYADYAVWERGWLEGELAERQRDHWRNALADLPPLLELVPSRRRETIQSYRGSALTFRYDTDLLEQARRLCSETGNTLYAVLISAYSLLLSRMTREDDIAVGSPLANRPYPALEQTPGLFFNSITVRTRVDERQTVRDFLAAVRRTTFEAFANQDLPFDQVVRAVAPERSSSHSPVFQNIFILQTYPGERFALPGVEAAPAPTPFYSAQYDLMFKLREDEDGLQGLIVHNDALLDGDDARRIADSFRRLVESMCATPDAPLAELSLMDPASAALIERWNTRTRRPVPPEPVHELIRHRLAENPETPALTFRGQSLTRGELAREADAVAAGLQAAGLRPGQRIGVMVPRSAELVAVLLGIMSAGMVYVPLDGAAPRARTDAMLESAECSALVLGAEYAHRCPDFAGPRLYARDLAHTTANAERPTATEESAYLIFTSGSTGRPKGVEVTHRNLANLFVALDEAVRLPSDPVWLSVTAVTFDIAVVELLWTLARGVRVVLAETSESLRLMTPADGRSAPLTVPELILAEGVTALQATPTMLRGVLALPDAERALRRLELLMVGGEALDSTLARRLKDLGIPCVLNMYGPTETTVWSTCWEVPAVPPDRILVGKPLANTAAHVVDARLNPVPVGMYGELVLTGAGVARGYAGSRDLTDERFPALPALCDQGRAYRTGDVARWLPSGDLELLGRIDNQVKVNGYRIELEEIERALNSLQGVAESAVVVQREGARAALVAHCVPRPGAVLDEAALRTALADLLPDQMLPAAMVSATALPTTSSGKTDRRALPPVPLGDTERAVTEPANDVEKRLLEVWREVLGSDAVGPADDFFRSGGTSILVAHLLTKVRTRVHADARIVDLFRYPSVQAYAAHLGGRADSAAPSGRHRTAEAQARHAARLQRRQQVSRKQRLRAAEGAADSD
ncbi:amino acid adenylation domain-containing protein [Streptomyces sp. NPDC005970]|uniref:non-ribosomal peptide synthetase n=1 Tax=Streptomyces sp. NPDC005970 TaxID=3156723 RepID=UPI0033F1154D